jgi:serine/threonine protein phosphatase PrpC
VWVFQTIAETDLGLIRDGNEDSALVSPRLIAVADGMGGHAGGEVASKIAVQTLAKLQSVLDDPEIDVDSREDLLLNITHEIDSEIARQSKKNSKLIGMGTTLTALHLEGKDAELLHVGDSRCYRYRGGKLTQLSYDHTVMQELIDQGRLTPEEVFDHPQRSVLTQALMGNSAVDPVLVVYPVELGDHFLLCSDGLTSVLSEFEILEIIRSVEAEELVAQLINATKAKGAPDNITILWARVVEGQLASSEHHQLIGAARE